MIRALILTAFFCWLPLSALAQNLPSGHPPITAGATAPGAATPAMPGDQAEFEFKAFTSTFDPGPVDDIPLQHNGRIKPLDTLAREAILFISGSYSPLGQRALKVFLALTVSPAGKYVEIIEIRDPELRNQLGFRKEKRRFSVADLDKSQLQQIAGPLIEKEQKNSRSLSPGEKKVLETYQQWSLTHSIVDGASFLQSLDFSRLNGVAAQTESPAITAGKTYLTALAQGQNATESALALKAAVTAQDVPEMLRPQMQHLTMEVFYNKIRIFFWVGILTFTFGLILMLPTWSQTMSKKTVLILHSIPVLGISAGLYMRILITGFAPVTNMYGTMVWVAFGIIAFSALLFYLYENRFLAGLLAAAAALVLLLTESIPLILSPDLDPIVAVLRSNYWLTIHVLTITISYAAFSIAMVIGNFALIRQIIFPEQENLEFFRTYAKYAYRMIQLGVFLLTAGIILGGIWADYSWGRFWGWDPKETWALIADVGFLAILHARHTGWLRDFGVLVASPLAYLLVIMAWYGVNFILAAGLHSYGFSSGGAMTVGIFVAVQFALFALGLLRHFGLMPSLRRTAPK